MSSRKHRATMRGLMRDQTGASAVEYGLILALVFLAVMGGIASLGTSVQSRWNAISNAVSKT